MLDSSASWAAAEEQAYRDLRAELTPAIRDRVIHQNSWWDLIRVAFDLAEEQFPLVYREDACDYLRPGKETLAELVYDLSTKSFEALTNRAVGDIYQSLLSSRQQQEHKLGAFYTPHADVEYMVSKLNLRRDAVVLDPCMGSGHFHAELYERLAELYAAEGYSREDAYREIVGKQLWGADIDTFATSLAAIRLFFLDEHSTGVRPHLYVHDMLLHSPERPQEELFRRDAARVVTSDPEVDELGAIDEVAFDAIVGNPPYGARKPKYKEAIYRALYGTTAPALNAGSIGTGDHDTYGMFFANGIERLREGGRLCLITNDSFRSLTTYAALRRHILDRCKIVEILLTDTRHFEGVSFQFAGMAITTLEKCSDPDARRAGLPDRGGVAGGSWRRDHAAPRRDRRPDLRPLRNPCSARRGPPLLPGRRPRRAGGRGSAGASVDADALLEAQLAQQRLDGTETFLCGQQLELATAPVAGHRAVRELDEAFREGGVGEVLGQHGERRPFHAETVEHAHGAVVTA